LAWLSADYCFKTILPEDLAKLIWQMNKIENKKAKTLKQYSQNVAQ
jgi:hypothetical protein